MSSAGRTAPGPSYSHSGRRSERCRSMTLNPSLRRSIVVRKIPRSRWKWQEGEARPISARRPRTLPPGKGTASLTSNSAPVRYDLSDLPPELPKELSEERRRQVEHPLIEIINGRGGTATLDEILIDLYRKYKKVGKRASVAKDSYFFRDGAGAGWCLARKVTTHKPDRCEITDGNEELPCRNREGCFLAVSGQGHETGHSRL